MAYFLAPFGNTPVIVNGVAVVGGSIKTYLAGTSTPATTFTSISGAVSQGVSMTLDANGLPENGPVWMLGGQPLKFRFFNAAGVSILDDQDDISGIGDTTTVTDEWTLYSAAPTYISATSFSVTGDQTNTFQVNRRVKTNNTGGTAYSRITASSFASSITTVTVINEFGALDSGLDAVSNGLSAVNQSLPLSPIIASINGGQIAGNRRFNMNGDFAINQALPATNADDTYAHDGWYALTQTGTIAVSTLSDVENGLPKMARLTQSQAVAQRMGYAQIIEGKRCKKHRGQQVTFKVGRTRLSSSANVRYAVLEWTGTEDAVTSDVVNDWTSSSYTAGNFFINTTLTVSGVSQQALTANTLTDGSELTVTLGSTFNNIILFEWTESTVAQNVTLDLGLAQGEPGTVATEYEHRADEMAEVLRHYCHTFADGTAPATGVAVGPIQIASTGSGNKDCFTWFFPVPMRGTPDTVTTYNPVSANANWRDVTAGFDRTAAVDLSSNKMVAVTSNPGTNGNLLRIHISASKRL